MSSCFGRSASAHQPPLLTSAHGTRKRLSDAGHEEVQPRERDQVHRQLPEISIQLAREPQASRYTTHSCTHKVVQITISGCRELQSAKANVVKCLVVQQHALIS